MMMVCSSAVWLILSALALSDVTAEESATDPSALLTKPVVISNNPRKRCGFHTDCPPNYQIEDVIASANTWDPTDSTAASQLQLRHTSAKSFCQPILQNEKNSNVQESGGWCLRNEKNTTKHLPNGHSYSFPASIHSPADDSIAEALHTLLTPEPGKFLSLNDFGAGVGQYGHTLLDMDARHRYTGYDGAGNIEEFTNGFLKFFDLTIPLSLPRKDWVFSLEVGEHIPHQFEGMVLRNFHAHNCKGIVMSWAHLKQNGFHHINNHRREYVLQQMTALGYEHDDELVEQMKAKRYSTIVDQAHNMDQTVSNSGFVGDMSYPGDGGDTLQRLYELWHWSEIPNCPGRYVTKRNTVAEAMSPINLLHLLGTADQIYEYDNIGNGVRGKDRVAIAQFRDGGGLITYIKPDSRFIHTLNTKSGFNRKLMSLGLAHQSVGVVNT